MPLFCCRRCNCVENTALADYWAPNSRKLCSECETGEWHGRFPKRPALGYLIDQSGGLWSHESVEHGDLPEHYRIVGQVGVEWPRSSDTSRGGAKPMMSFIGKLISAWRHSPGEAYPVYDGETWRVVVHGAFGWPSYLRLGSWEEGAVYWAASYLEAREKAQEWIDRK